MSTRPTMDETPIYRQLTFDRLHESLAEELALTDPRPLDERTPTQGTRHNPLGVAFAVLAGAAIMVTVVSFIASVMS